MHEQTDIPDLQDQKRVSPNAWPRKGLMIFSNIIINLYYTVAEEVSAINPVAYDPDLDSKPEIVAKYNGII